MRLGANEVVLSTDAAAMKAHAKSFDFILDAVSAPHSLDAYTELLKLDATMALVGLPDKPPTINAGQPDLQARRAFRVDHRRHAGDAADARLLRQEKHHGGCRGDSHPENQRSLRADAEAGCEVPLRDRYELAEVRAIRVRRKSWFGSRRALTLRGPSCSAL